LIDERVGCVHRRCVPMNVALLDAWSAVEYQFFCRACAFHDDKYNTQTALSRFVLRALLIYRKTSTTSRVLNRSRVSNTSRGF